MKILVSGRNPMGHNFVAAVGRSWTTTPRLVEVVDIKAGEYLKPIDINGNVIAAGDRQPCVDGDDPPPVVMEVKNPTTNRMDQQLRPDPDRIGRLAYEELSNDGRISIKQTDAVSADAADAAVAAARSEVSRLSAENLDLKARIAELESGEALKAALAELAETKALIAAATEPESPAAPAPEKPKKGDGKKG